MCQMLVDYCEYGDAPQTPAALMHLFQELCKAHGSGEGKGMAATVSLASTVSSLAGHH